MTSVFNYLWWGTSDPDKLDPVTGLSTRDLHLLRKSWAKLFAQPIDSGMLLFVKLFRAEPSTQDLFKTIKGQPEEQFTSIPLFKAHVLGVMSSLNLAITTLYEPPVVEAMMRKLGWIHRKFHVRPEHFNMTTRVMVDILKNDFQAKDDVVAAWGRFFEFLYKPLFEVLTVEE